MHISSSYAKILGEKLFAHGSFPEVGQKQKMEEKKERERAKVGDNNGQAMHGAPKHAWRTQAAWAKKNNKKNNVKVITHLLCMGCPIIRLFNSTSV